MDETTSDPKQTLAVYRASDLLCTGGASIGDRFALSDDLLLDDIYRLSFDARPTYLTFLPSLTTASRIAEGSAAGRAGRLLHLDCALTFMSDDGQAHEALLFSEIDAAGAVNEIYIAPLNTLDRSRDHRLIEIDASRARQRMAQLACVSFTHGTHITLASGEQRVIEALQVGDAVLTRNDGAQNIRWIGTTTARATGASAPICITAGTLNNTQDLILSRNHRLFVYQRRDVVGAGRSEILIQAGNLVNGKTVVQQAGGFVDYVQLLFDNHQIVYAEGIAAESMLIDARTRPLLQGRAPTELQETVPDHDPQRLAGFEVDKTLLIGPDTPALLRKASRG